MNVNCSDTKMSWLKTGRLSEICKAHGPISPDAFPRAGPQSLSAYCPSPSHLFLHSALTCFHRMKLHL